MPTPNVPNHRPLYPARAIAFALSVTALTAVLTSKGLPCGIARTFHVPCPGCGSTRAVLALLHGDVAGVMLNPLAPVLAALVGIAIAQGCASLFARGDFTGVGQGRIGRALPQAVLVVAALEVLVWIARFCGAFGGPVPV